MVMATDYFVSYSFRSGVLSGFGSEVVAIDGHITEATLTELKAGLQAALIERDSLAEDTNVVILNWQPIGNFYFAVPDEDAPYEAPEGWVFVPDRLQPISKALPAALGEFQVRGKDGQMVPVPWKTVRHIYAAVVALYKPAAKHMTEKTA